MDGLVSNSTSKLVLLKFLINQEQKPTSRVSISQFLLQYRRPDDRVRDDRTSLVVPASATKPAYVYQASLAIAQDIPAGGLATFPASPVTADLQGQTEKSFY